MNIFQLIQDDHLQIDQLLSRLDLPPGQADFDEAGRQYLLDRLISVASRHEAAEEMVFWPHVRHRLPDGKALADDALQAESDAKALLDLMRFAGSEGELIDECRRLHSLVQQHAAFEEETVFPALRRRTTRIWSALAGLEFRVARRTGPTRPHPGGPTRPLPLVTAGAPAVLLDHLRDLRRRSRRRPVGFETPDRPGAIEILSRHHQQIATTLSRLAAEDDPGDADVFAVIHELSLHDSIERQYLYPVIRRRLQEGNRLYDNLISEHGSIARLASDLDVYRFHDEARKSWIEELDVKVRTHIDEEETGVFPALAARMTREELVDLGDLLDRARTKAPTHPHPHLAGAGAGARLSRLVAGPLDRARDTLTRR